MRKTGHSCQRGHLPRGCWRSNCCLGIFHRLKMTKQESNAVELSIPEEQIAHSTEVRQSRWQRTPDTELYMQKAIGKNMATCAVMIEICEFGGNKRNAVAGNQNGLVLIPGVSCRLHQWVGWASAAPCLPGQQRPAWGQRPGKPWAHPNPFQSGLSLSPWHIWPLQLSPLGGTWLRKSSSPFKKTVWASPNTGTRTLYS